MRFINRSFDPVQQLAVAAFLLACSPVILRSQEATSSLTGRLQDPSGAALADNYVILKTSEGAAYQTTTDEQGIYRFSGLPAVSYTLTVSVIGFNGVKIKQSFSAGEQKSLPPVRLSVGVAGDCFPPADIDPEQSRFLPSGPSLGGLAGIAKGELGPVVGARVSLECWLGQCKGYSKIVSTDSQGDFVFEDLRPGSYNFSIQHAGFFPTGEKFNIAGGLESSYSFKLTPCPNGDCSVKPDPSVKPIVCE